MNDKKMVPPKKAAANSDNLGKLAKVSDLYQIISELFRHSLERHNDITKLVNVFSNKKKSALPYKDKQKLLYDTVVKDENRIEIENSSVAEVEAVKITEAKTIKYIKKMAKKMVDQFPYFKLLLSMKQPSSMHVAIIMDEGEIEKPYDEVCKWAIDELRQHNFTDIINKQYWTQKGYESYYRISELLWLLAYNSQQIFHSYAAMYQIQLDQYALFHPSENSCEMQTKLTNKSIQQVYSSKQKPVMPIMNTAYDILMKYNAHSIEEVGKYCRRVFVNRPTDNKENEIVAANPI